MELAEEWKSRTLTPTGGRSSSMKVKSSVTSKMERLLMFQVVKMLKVNQLSFGANTVERIRDGMLSILTKLKKNQLKVLMMTLDSTSIDHSILYPDSQCTDLLLLMETITSHSTDGLIQERFNNNGGSMEFQRLSETITGRTTAWKSHQVVEPMNLESPAESTLDGGNSSDLMAITL